MKGTARLENNPAKFSESEPEKQWIKNANFEITKWLNRQKGKNVEKKSKPPWIKPEFLAKFPSGSMYWNICGT